MNTITHNDFNPVSVTFSDCFNEYRKGKTGDKRLTSKAARKAARAMREHRKNKTAIYTFEGV